MHIFLVHILGTLLSYGSGDLLHPLEHECCSKEIAFDTNIHVEALVVYPQFADTSALARYVNDTVRKDMDMLYEAYVQDMSSPQENISEEEEFNMRIWRYKLEPIYHDSNLLSLYGVKYQDSGGVHGSVRYISRTFWQDGNMIRELSLNDLFLPGSREWLFQHCEDYFKATQCGYYSDDDIAWISFNPEDLDSFVFTKKGLLLIFQNYVVSGYEDEPITLLIPYDNLSSIANSSSLLDHLITKKDL